MEQAERPLPNPDSDTLPFWDAVQRERLVVQHCINCDRMVHYPRRHCPFCLSDDQEWIESEGRGVIYSFTVIRRSGHPYFRQDVPYAVGIIEIDGVHILAPVSTASLESLAIGMEVEIDFKPAGDRMKLPVFRPVSEGTR